MSEKHSQYAILTLFAILFTTSCALSWDRPDAGPDILIDSNDNEESAAQPEICNGLDDDLDGDIDEDFDCAFGRLVECTTECGSTGNGNCTSECAIPGPAECIPPPEECNGLDDDCIGGPDDPFTCVMGEEEACTTACGDGTHVCGADCTWGSCVGEDEWDCNPGQTRDCSDTLDCGVGTKTCDAECHWGDCIQETRPEICNEHDDDCDFTSDEGVLIKLSDDIRVTDTPDPSDIPYVVWTVSEFFVAWIEGTFDADPALSRREVFAARLDAAGMKIGGDIQVTNTGGDHFPAIPVVASTEIGLLWGDYRNLSSYDVYMARISFSGTILDEIRLVGSAGNAWYAGPVWSGLNYGVSWQDTRLDPDNPDIFFQTFNSTGTPSSAEVNATNTEGFEEDAQRPLWTGSEYLVVFAGESTEISQCRMARFSPAGTLVSPPVDLVDERSYFCIPSWITSDEPAFTGFGMTWMTASGSGGSNLRFALFNPDGGRAAGPITVIDHGTQSVFPVTLYNQDHNAVAMSWSEQQWDSGGECHFAEVNVDPFNLQVVTSPTKVSESGNNVQAVCTMAWSGSTYGFAWQDSRHGESEVYFALFGCP